MGSVGRCHVCEKIRTVRLCVFVVACFFQNWLVCSV